MLKAKDKKILVVDDDPHIMEVILFALKSGGYNTVNAQDGEEALEVFKKENPSLIVLDINLPKQDGLWVCQEIRKISQVPILFLSARDDEVDRVMGLTIGGDDYVTKPFSPRELTARVQAILRRQEHLNNNKLELENSEIMEKGNLKLNLDSFTAYWQDQKAELTVTEFNILKVMLKRPTKVFTRDELLNLAYQDTIVSDRTIDSHILHIRKKFNSLGVKNLIKTQHGIGYKLNL